ncbi:hypothetical protein OHW35_10900 [Acinetobacter baumannii]|nr:hypothetical protein [Acinetobacter baumannii]MDC5056934.1 hypothetical protein [Acinetobacter baumannii]MDV7434312.1 hypothetical protein [Acinetobacter baumannii]
MDLVLHRIDDLVKKASKGVVFGGVVHRIDDLEKRTQHAAAS